MAQAQFDATIVFMAVAGEEQGLLGSTYFAEQAKQQGMDIEGMFTNDIVGSSLGQNGVRDPNTCALFAEGVRRRDAERGGDAAQRPAARTTPRRASSRASSRRPPRARATGMQRADHLPRDRYLRGGDHIPFLERRYPAARFTEVNEDYRHQHQDVRVENGVQYGDLPQFVDFAYIARVARVNAATLAGLASAPGDAEGRRDRAHAQLYQRHRPRVGRQHGARSRGLRDRLARHDRAVLDAHDPRSAT